MAELNAMTLAELKSLEKKVTKSISRFEMREKKKALAALKAKAKELGYSFDELTAEAAAQPEAKRPRRKVPPKYANPKDLTQTWTGRGRRPAWVKDALESGKSLDDMTI